MIFLDPAEAKHIKELLDSNQPVAAAELLNGSTHKDHSSVRPLVTRCLEQLMDAADVLLRAGALETARQHAHLANDLRPLSGSHAALRVQIDAAVAERDVQAGHENGLLAEARQLADAGRLHTAMERVEPINDHAAAKRLKNSLDAKLKTYNRLTAELKSLLDAGNVRGATLILQKLRALYPSGADVHQLSSELEQQRTKDAVDPEHLPVVSRRTINRDDPGVILDFGVPDLNTLLLFRNTVVIGAAANSGTTADIRISCNSLHRQHAVILRHERYGKMIYWLMSHPSHNKFTGVTQVDPTGELKTIVLSGDGASHAVKLEDGATICMGEKADTSTVRLVFRIQSDSAVLERVSSQPNTDAKAVAHVEANNVHCRYVGLFHDRFVIGRDALECNVCISKFPINALEYSWNQSQLTFAPEDDRDGIEACCNLDDKSNGQILSYNSKIALDSDCLIPSPTDLVIHHRPTRSS